MAIPEPESDTYYHEGRRRDRTVGECLPTVHLDMNSYIEYSVSNLSDTIRRATHIGLLVQIDYGFNANSINPRTSNANAHPLQTLANPPQVAKKQESVGKWTTRTVMSPWTNHLHLLLRNRMGLARLKLKRIRSWMHKLKLSLNFRDRVQRGLGELRSDSRQMMRPSLLGIRGR